MSCALGKVAGRAVQSKISWMRNEAGDRHDDAKVLTGFGNAGVLEVVEDDRSGTYRAVYTVKFKEAVFVLHCFQKKVSRASPRLKRISPSSAPG